MANVKEDKIWEEGIYQLEVTDPVVGGIDGISNKQAKQLANRTSYLKKQLENDKNSIDTALAKKRDIEDSYSKTEVDEKFTAIGTTIGEKLGKSETAADSAKLGGVAADKYAKKDNIPSDDLIREFSHTATAKQLPDGDYGSSSFWENIKPGIYYATREKGSNKPENYGLVEVVSNGEVSVTWSYGGNTYKWYKYFNNSTSAWRRLAISGENALPAGIIIVSARASTPDGFLLCDGSALSRTSYSTLFEAIGTAYGAGNGSSTFNIPDLRGEFIRGADSGRGVDAGRALGSAQGDAIRNITGWFNTWANDRKDSGGVFRIEKDIGTGDGNGTSDPVWKVVFEPERLVPVANENRPRNVAVNFYIKY